MSLRWLPDLSDLVGIDDPASARRAAEGTRRAGFHTGPHGVMPSLPFGKAAVQHRHRVVSKPAKQPPQATGVHAVVLVIRDDLDGGVDAQPAECLNQRRRIGLRMPAVPPVFRSRQIAVQARVYRPWDVALRILPVPAASSERSKRQSTRAIGIGQPMASVRTSMSVVNGTRLPYHWRRREGTPNPITSGGEAAASRVLKFSDTRADRQIVQTRSGRRSSKAPMMSRLPRRSITILAATCMLARPQATVAAGRSGR